MRTPKNPAMANKKVHTGRFVNDEAYDENTHDFGPWVMTPKSTRVGGFRYDFLNKAIHVQWTGKGLSRTYMYMEVPYEIYRSMVRIASKGKFINSTLNNFDYRPATPDEVDAPSNDERIAPKSRQNLAGARP
jgi:hypothetical protein